VGPPDGEPLCNAIVWQDTRTKDLCDALAADGGAGPLPRQGRLPLATYFSGPKMRWMLEHVPAVRDAAAAGRLALGTVDAWLIWNLTGGRTAGARDGRDQRQPDDADGPAHARVGRRHAGGDARAARGAAADRARRSTASRGASRARTARSAPRPGLRRARRPARALVGPDLLRARRVEEHLRHRLLHAAQHRHEARPEHERLLTTVATVQDEPPVYALEGSIAVAGSLVQWLRDNLGVIASPATSSRSRAPSPTTAGSTSCRRSPGCSPLLAERRARRDRGHDRYANKGHLARAVLEAAAFQTRDVLDAMERDSGVTLTSLRVDGGMAVNDLLMQFQADVLGVPRSPARPSRDDALGAAYAAGLSVGVWSGTDELRKQWRADKTWATHAGWTPTAAAAHRVGRKAVERSMGWES
jgi:glycerol kinase